MLDALKKDDSLKENYRNGIEIWYILWVSTVT